MAYDESGNLHLKAVDFESSHTEIVLSANGFQLSVTFLMRRPNKKPQWQEINDQSLRQSYSSSLLGKTNERRLRMVYDYVKITQIHSINRFPHRWCYPVSLLLQEK